MPVRDDHQELLIVKGVAAARGDSTSSENGLASINLLSDEGEPGWSLNADGGWIPKRAQLKGSGTWADSAVSPGRTLVSGEDGNVIETLQLTVTGTSILDLAAQLTRMGRMRQAVLDFWTNPRVIDPVYLHWYARDGAGAQYALIYAIDIAEDEPDVWQNPIRDVTITIERESYWRGLPPGMNPKIWTHEQIRHVINWTTSDLNLTAQGSGSDVNHALSGTVTNNDRSPSNNYLEISAANVPGDAPALLQLAMALSTLDDNTKAYIAVRSEPFEFPNISAGFISTLDASDAVNGTNAADVADATVASGNRVDVTPGTATDSLRLTFTVNVPVYQGRFAIYMRAYQSAVTAGDWKAHLEINAASTSVTGFPTIVLPEQVFEVTATHWPLVYMGEIQIPAGIEAGMNSAGDGISETAFTLLLYARRTAGASVLRIADLILMPLDNAHAYITSTHDTTKNTDLHIDNTGYLAHGKPGVFSAPLLAGGLGNQFGLSEYIGQPLYLEPRKKNRVYFIRSLVDTTAGIPTSTFAVRGNVVPRWSGIRDA